MIEPTFLKLIPTAFKTVPIAENIGTAELKMPLKLEPISLKIVLNSVITGLIPLIKPLKNPLTALRTTSNFL